VVVGLVRIFLPVDAYGKLGNECNLLAAATAPKNPPQKLWEP